jgi:HK97 gp10 family phage protein
MASDLSAFNRHLDRLPKTIKTALARELASCGDLIVARMKENAPHESGELADNIRAMPANEGLKVEIISDTDHSAYVEFGTSDTPAEPFFYPTINALEPEVNDRLAKALRKAISND